MRVVPLGDVCTIVGGGTPRRNNEAYFGGDIPWATPTDVTALSDLSIAQTKETITETGLRESSARLVPTGTVLLTSRATIGYTAIAERPMATNQGFANFICGDYLVPEYLAYWLRGQQDHLIRLAGGTTFKEISKSTLKGIPIPLPPIDEQRRIAGILDRAARIERLRTRATDLLHIFASALFVKMFGDPADNPMGWRFFRLGDICTINPRINRSEFPENDTLVSFVPMAAVDGRFGAITIHEERPLVEVSKGFTSFEDGDVLFAKITPCMENGKVALARNLTNGIGCGSTEFYVLRPSDRVLDEYIYHFVRRARFREEAKRNFTGTAGQQRVPKSFMENALIPLPSLTEQRRFASVVNRSARATAIASAASKATSALTASLMDRLLDGSPVP